MESDGEEIGRSRRWTHALVGVAVVGVLVAAVSFVVTRSDEPATRTDRSRTTTTLRQCVDHPSATSPIDLDDVVYAGRITPAADATTVDLRMDSSSAGYTLGALPVANDVAVVGAPADSWATPPASSAERARAAIDLVAFLGGQTSVHLDGGTVTAFDLVHVAPDDPFGRGTDPCTPSTGCRRSDEPVPHAWPGGVDGRLGNDLTLVPDSIAVALAKWGLDVEPAGISRAGTTCEALAVLDAGPTLRLRLARTDDGYVLAGATTDPAGEGNADQSERPATPVCTSSTDRVTFPLGAEIAAQWPGAAVTVMVRFGERSAKAQTSIDVAGLDVPIKHRASQNGSCILMFRGPDGALQRLVAEQTAARTS